MSVVETQERIDMKSLKFIAAFAIVGITFGSFAEEGLTKAQESLAKAGPRNMKIMIAGFGTIESMTQVDAWLGEQLQPSKNLNSMPTLSQGEKISNPDLNEVVVRMNWNTRKLEYLQDAEMIRSQNERNRRMLTALRTKVLTDDSTRYVPLAKDYLQSSLMQRSRSLIQVLDRSNADMNMVEQQLGGNNSSALAGATCILTAAMGDREEDSRIVTVNGKGTQVKITKYTQPYVGKVRDLEGNVLFAFHGASEWSSTVNSVVQSTVSDPARKLVESACEQIAEKLVAFFTTHLKFRVKVPEGMDEDDVEIEVNGKEVDAEEGVRVLALEHAVVAELEGCKTIRRIVALDEPDGSKTVRLRFKKKAKGAGSED